MDTLVKVRDLHKVYYRGSEQIDVLQGITLDIPSGDFLALTIGLRPGEAHRENAYSGARWAVFLRERGFAPGRSTTSATSFGSSAKRGATCGPLWDDRRAGHPRRGGVGW